MITINVEKCSRCGLCADLCHESCISITEIGPSIDYRVCSTCTQCIAACPTRALSWDGVAPIAFNRALLPQALQLDEMFRERRSIRRFKQEKIDRSLLEEIAKHGNYAPTHAFNLRTIIVDDKSLIDILDQAIITDCRWIYNLAFRFKVAGTLAGWFGQAAEMNRSKPKIEAVLERGHAFHSMPTAFIFIVGDKKVPFSTDSAQYSLANIMYYAQVRGVGTCLWALGPLFIDKNRRCRKELRILPNERIFGAMYLGYPAIRFTNLVRGKQMDIQWNGGLSERAMQPKNP